MWECRAALAALFLCAGTAQAQVQMSQGCLKYPRLAPPSGRLPASPKFFADFQPWPDGSRPSMVEVIYSNLPSKVQDSFVEYLESVRWTCGEMPVGARRKLEWSWVGSQRAQFTEPKLTLSRFLARMKEVPDERVDFNLDEMGCPFIVEWRSFRPAAPNRATVMSAPADPRQDSFLKWLAGLELDVSDAVRGQLIGEAMEVQVPCGRIKLAPPTAAASSAG